jgi:vancomycin resistance protein YoaR
MPLSQERRSARTVLAVIRRPVEFLCFSLSICVVLLLLGLVLFEGYHLRRIYPGVRALHVDLGGLDLAHAAANLPENVDAYLALPLRLRFGDQEWSVEGAQVGVHFDRQTIAHWAHNVGRRHDLFTDLREQWISLQVGSTVPYKLSFRANVADELLGNLADQINRPVRNANVEVRGLEVIAEQSQTGRTLDLEASRARIFSRMRDLSGGQVDLVVHETLPSFPDASRAALEVERLISSPVLLGLPDGALRMDTSPPGPWVISRDLLASAIRLEMTDVNGAGAIVVSLNRDVLRPLVEHLAAQLAIPSVNARLLYDPAKEEFTELTPSSWGQRVDEEATMEQVLAATELHERQVTIPLLIEEPAVSATSAPGLGIKNLVVEAVTSFKGSSQARIQNITIAAAQFHGVVVAPGEVFSFNQHLGEVSAETGYEDSLIIVGDQTRVGIGGGVCQVSTTAFRAAAWGGYPIVERWAHGYRVRAYEPPVGLDATVYAPQVDLKFRNDTPYHILIQTQMDPKERTIAFRFFSTSIGRHTEMDDPVMDNRVPHGPDIIVEDPTLAAGTRKQVDWAVDGLDASITRRVYRSDRLLREDVFFSRYRPWQARYLVGTKPVDEDTAVSALP